MMTTSQNIIGNFIMSLRWIFSPASFLILVSALLSKSPRTMAQIRDMIQNAKATIRGRRVNHHMHVLLFLMVED